MVTKKRTRARAKPIVATPAEPAASVPEEPVAPASPTIAMVTVGSLQVGDQFERDGERYRRLPPVAGKIVALHLTNPEKGWIGVRQTAFDSSTLVIKK